MGSFDLVHGDVRAVQVISVCSVRDIFWMREIFLFREFGFYFG